MRSPLKVHQFSAVVREEDAIGNEIAALHEIFRDQGFDSRIKATRSGNLYGIPIEPNGVEGADLLVVHYSHWSDRLPEVLAARCRKILLYHSVTPESYFAMLHPAMPKASSRARSALQSFAGAVDRAVAHSDFSGAELAKAGFENVSKVAYLQRSSPFRSAEPGVLALEDRESSRTLLVVGRVAPHKRLDLAITVADYLMRYVDPRWRLFVVGGDEDFAVHRAQLHDLSKWVDMRRVVFTGHVPQASLTAYYRIADAFVCMSDHEGFGVPLAEAMQFDLPVFARATSAVPEIVGNAGVLFQPDTSVPIMAETIAQVMNDLGSRSRILAAQRKKLTDLRREVVARQWFNLVTSLLPAAVR
jgi:glycosyltransferase involved in cell wall biosynthesis